MAMINFAPRFRGDADRAGPMPARRMQLADALMGRQTPNAMYSKGEGIAHVVDKSLAGFLAGQTERDAMAADLADGELLANVFMPGGSAANPQAAAMGNILAGGEQGSRSMEGSGGFPASLIETESSGRWNALNDEVGANGIPGHGGRLQFGGARLQDAANAGIIPAGMTPQQFAQQPPEVQMAVENWHFQDIDREIQRRGLDQFIGQNIGGTPATLDGMRAVAHLGGIRGLERFVTSGGRYNPSDSFGTSLSNYFSRHAGNTPSMADMPAPGASPASGQAQPDIAQALAQLHPENQPQAAYASMPGEDPQQIGAMLLGQPSTLAEAGIDPRETFFARTGGADSFGLDGPEPFTRGAIPDQNALIGLGPRGGGVAAMEANPLAVPEQPQPMPPMQPPVEVPPAPPVTSVADMPAPQAMPAQAQSPQMMIDPEPYAGDGWIPPDVGRALAAQQMGQPIPPQAMGAALMGGASQPAMAAGMPQQAGGGAMPPQGGGMPMQGGMPAGGAPMPAQTGMGGGDMDAALRQALANPRTRNAAIQVLQQRQAEQQRAAQEQAERERELAAFEAAGIDPRFAGNSQIASAAASDRFRAPPTSAQEFQFSQENPGFIDFLTQQAEAKRPQTTVHVSTGTRSSERFGDAPKDEVWAFDPETGEHLTSIDEDGRERPISVPIDSGDQRDARRSASVQFRAVSQRAGFAMRDANRISQLLDEVPSNTVIRIGQSYVPGSPAHTMERFLSSLKDSVAAMELIGMKMADTGVGAVPQAQWESFGRLVGYLGQDININELRDILEDFRIQTAETIGMLPEDELSEIARREISAWSEGRTARNPPQGGQPQGDDDDISDLLKLYGN